MYGEFMSDYEGERDMGNVWRTNHANLRKLSKRDLEKLWEHKLYSSPQFHGQLMMEIERRSGKR